MQHLLIAHTCLQQYLVPTQICFVSRMNVTHQDKLVIVSSLSNI